MNYSRLLAIYHYASLYHGGQSSRLYALLCRVSHIFTPSRSEEYTSVLTQEGYEAARAIFVRLVRSEVGAGSGCHACPCCGMPHICDDAEADVSLCGDCAEAGCDPREPCSVVIPCMAHEDCRQCPELGAACAASEVS